MKKTLLNLSLFSLVLLLCFTACQKENIKIDELPTQEVVVDEALQAALDEMGITYDELINTAPEQEVTPEATGTSSEEAGERGDAFCCEITGHQFWTNGQPCSHNSRYTYYANSGKYVLARVIQNQVVGNTVNTFTLAGARYRPVNDICYEANMNMTFTVLDLPGFNYVISNMWIIEAGVGVCAHYSDSAVLPCP